MSDEKTAKNDEKTARKVQETLRKTLAADPKTRDPLNALVVWTELGKGLSGTLHNVGAGRGMIRQVISAHCAKNQAEPNVDLSTWIYRLEGKERLGKVEAGVALRRVEADLEDALPALTAHADRDPDGRQRFFISVVTGWFPIGIELFRALPAARTASDQAVLGAFLAWCLKYLPESDAADVGPLLPTGLDPEA